MSESIIKKRVLIDDKLCHACGDLMSSGSEYLKIKIGSSIYARCCSDKEECKTELINARFGGGGGGGGMSRPGFGGGGMSRPGFGGGGMPRPGFGGGGMPRPGLGGGGLPRPGFGGGGLSRPANNMTKPIGMTSPTRVNPQPMRKSTRVPTPARSSRSLVSTRKLAPQHQLMRQNYNGPWRYHNPVFWYSPFWFGFGLNVLYMEMLLAPWTFGYYANLGSNYIEDAPPKPVISLRETEYVIVRNQKDLKRRLNTLNQNLNQDKEQWVPEFDENVKNRVRFIKLENPNFK